MPKFRVHGITTVEVIADIDAESYDEAVNKANENLCYVSDYNDTSEHSVVGIDDMKFVFDEEIDYKWSEKIEEEEKNKIVGEDYKWYEIGDILVCKNRIDTGCLEMTNHRFYIEVGDRYIVTDKSEYFEETGSQYYELTSEKDEDIILNAWNDRDHTVLDDNFYKA